MHSVIMALRKVRTDRERMAGCTVCRMIADEWVDSSSVESLLETFVSRMSLNVANVANVANECRQCRQCRQPQRMSPSLFLQGKCMHFALPEVGREFFLRNESLSLKSCVLWNSGVFYSG